MNRVQAEHARSVLSYATAHPPPYPGAGVRLAVLMLTLRTARAGTGNITGQGLSGRLHDDAELVLEQLAADGWLVLPGSTAEVMASRPENPCAFTVPALLPDQPIPFAFAFAFAFAFGKTHRARISGWAQKVIGDRTIHKKKLDPATKLLALCTAAHTRDNSQLGSAEGGGLGLDGVDAYCGLSAGGIAAPAELPLNADWFTQVGTTDGRLRGQLAARVLPLAGLL
ncbi:hypothetical protein ACQB60_41115 [Actinomycetota bacterium Odt1-20B]